MADPARVEVPGSECDSRENDSRGLLLDGEQREVFFGALSLLAEHEASLTTQLYERFFESRPDSVCLFGEHSISEREEMVRETFRALLAWLDDAPWLEENLSALGRSHAEYGVESDMYPPFVEALVESAGQVFGGRVEESALSLLRQAVEDITRVMSEAGEKATSSP